MQIVSRRKMVLDELNSACAEALEKCGAKAEEHAKQYCPVVTGKLRDSLRHEPEGDRTMIIGASAPYAAYVELGHHQEPGRYVPAIGKRLVRSFVPGKPYLRPALDNHQDEYRTILTTTLNGNED